MTETIPKDIGDDRQLFVDGYWMDTADGVRRILHHPERGETAISIEHPWEADSVGYVVTFKDRGKYRMWYRCNPKQMAAPRRNARLTAYAESEDGIHWEKPSLGIIEFEGSRDNNLVWAGPGINMAPFLDGNPDTPDDQRHKAIVRTYGTPEVPDRRGVLALASPDGIRWRTLEDDPIMTEGPFDSHNIAFWDTNRKEYVAYTRGVGGGDGPFRGGHRWIRRATSKDFVNWSALENIEAGDTPFEHLYTNSCVQYERAPGVYLMFPSRLVLEHTPDPHWPEGPGVNDIVFMSSRDGLHFDRGFMEAFIGPGHDRGNWHERGIYMGRGILHTSPEELSMYGEENTKLPTQRVTRYVLRTDGFVSVNAGYGGGEFTTKPLMFTGSELELNYSTSAIGSVRVEMQDAEGRPRPGYTLDDCPEIFGDEIEGVVEWRSGGDVSALAGKPVRLRFVMKDADLYAFRFRAKEGKDG